MGELASGGGTLSLGTASHTVSKEKPPWKLIVETGPAG